MKIITETYTNNQDYIYIISDNQNRIKVGISKNPEKRLKQLQTGHPNKLSLIFTEEFECERAHLLKIEALIHKELRNRTRHMKGEWFYIDENQLQDIKDIITWNRIRYDSDPLAFKFR